MKRLVWFFAIALASCMANSLRGADEPVLRVGIVGCDTSHVIAFTQLINDPKASGSLGKCEVTVAYPGGSPDLPDSRDRVDGFVEQLRPA